MPAIHRKDGYKRDFDITPVTQQEIINRWRGKEFFLAKLVKDMEFEPFAQQHIFLTSTATYNVLGSGRRAGKTTSATKKAAAFADPTPMTVYKYTPRLNDEGKKVQDALGYDILDVARDEEGNPVVLRESTVQRELLRMHNVKIVKGRPIVGCIVLPDRQNYKVTERMFLEALGKLVGPEGKGYQYNRNDHVVFIPSRTNPQSIVDIKSASDGSKLRGEGYSWTYWDEPAFIPSNEAWESFEPSLTDLNGTGIFTTTPADDEDSETAWWFFDEFIDPERPHKNTEYFQWFSLHNPEYSPAKWEEMMEKKHPLVFQREYMGEWKRGGGRELKQSWLNKWQYKYGDRKEPEDSPDHGHLDMRNGRLNRARYQVVMGVDPATKDKETSDFTVISVFALDRETGIVYLVDMLRGQWQFSDIIEKIKEKARLWDPDLVGIESIASQIFIAQELQMDSEFPPVHEVYSKGSKKERIRARSPHFRSGWIRIPDSETVMDRPEFMDALLQVYKEWEEFPMKGKKIYDDTLDSMDIGVRTLGIIAPRVGLFLKEIEQQAEDDAIRDGKPFERSIRSLRAKRAYNKDIEEFEEDSEQY